MLVVSERRLSLELLGIKILRISPARTGTGVKSVYTYIQVDILVGSSAVVLLPAIPNVPPDLKLWESVPFSYDHPITCECHSRSDLLMIDYWFYSCNNIVTH